MWQVASLLKQRTFASSQKVVLHGIYSVLGNPEDVMIIIIFVKCCVLSTKKRSMKT